MASCLFILFSLSCFSFFSQLLQSFSGGVELQDDKWARGGDLITWSPCGVKRVAGRLRQTADNKTKVVCGWLQTTAISFILLLLNVISCSLTWAGELPEGKRTASWREPLLQLTVAYTQAQWVITLWAITSAHVCSRYKDPVGRPCQNPVCLHRQVLLLFKLRLKCTLHLQSSEMVLRSSCINFGTLRKWNSTSGNNYISVHKAWIWTGYAPP